MKIPTALLFVAVVAAGRAQSLWVLRFDGIGPVKIGMTVSQLNAALRERFAMPQTKEPCFYVGPKNHPQVSFMIEDGYLVRVDVNKPGIGTKRGVHVGDTEAHVKDVYGPEVKIEPSQYSGDEGGHYLTLRSSDRQYALRFETEEGKVTAFYAGKYEAVQYVEGCL